MPPENIRRPLSPATFPSQRYRNTGEFRPHSSRRVASPATGKVRCFLPWRFGSNGDRVGPIAAVAARPMMLGSRLVWEYKQS